MSSEDRGRLSGVIPAMITPFKANGDLHLEAIPGVVEFLLAQQPGALFVCGSSGEWWTLTLEERQAIAAAAIEAVAGRVKVMIHVGAPATRHAVQLARHAREVGADAVSALPPTGHVFSPDAIWAHFRAIGAAAELPLYLYHLPQVVGDLITIDKFLSELDTVPNLAGAKFSSYRIDDMINLRTKAKGRLNIISGCGEQLLSAIVNGAEGSICTWFNLYSRLGNEIVASVSRCDLDRARRLQEQLVLFGSSCCGNGIGTVKAVMASRGLDVGEPRSPGRPLSPEQQTAVLKSITDLELIEWLG